ncbi:MAG: DUF6456 domain-containing protein [Alphaproteobacteria bacterium]|nr:DUF6456 domain-containing protein [Alphaproteobacteria bacterium]
MKSRRTPVSSDRRLKENAMRLSLESLGESSFIPDFGPPERWQHAGRTIEVTDLAGSVASRTVEECVLDILYLQQHITKQHLHAALRFKSDFLEADMGAHLTGSYNPARVITSYYAGCDDRNEQQELAYRRWRGAVEAVGDMLCDCIITVVCHDIPPNPMHILPLQMGLVQLAAYYKISSLNDDVDQASAWEIGVSGARGSEANGSRRRLH